MIDALIRRHVNAAPARKIRSLLHLAQTHTYGPLAAGEDAGTLTVDQNLDHLDRIADALGWLHAGVQHPAHPPCSVLIDTLHLTHCVRPGVLKWADAEVVDRRCAALGIKLLVLHVEPDAIWDRLINDRRETPFLGEYCRKFGSSDRDLHAHFVREQERLTEMFARSAMQKVMIANNGEVEAIVDDAYELWVRA